jgi:hypothetical protein
MQTAYSLSGGLVKKCGLKNPAFAGSGLNRQQTLNACVFALVHDDATAQMTLLLLRFRACDVTQPGAIARYFTCASHLETLLGAGVGFHFRHDKNDVFLKMERKGSTCA